MDFFDRVKKIAKEKKGLSVQEFVLSIGLNHDSYYSLKKAGNLPRADEAIKIARDLKTTVEYLVTGEEKDISHEILDLAIQIDGLSKNDKEDLLSLLNTKLARKRGQLTPEKKGQIPQEQK